MTVKSSIIFLQGTSVALVILAALVLFNNKVHADPKPLTVTGVVSVYDGDTLRVNLDCDAPLFCDNMPIRVRGIDAPEIRGKCEAEKQKAIQARNVLRALIEQATKEGRTVVLHEPERGKYFRLVADVTINGASVAQALINQGLARPYDGGKREGWCG